MPRPPLAAAVLAATAIACAGRQASAPPADEAPPLLQLPTDVRPLRYALDLEVVPSSPDGIRGAATIEIALDRPRRTIWLHASGLTVSEATAEQDGAAVAARFAQVTPTGVARLDLDLPLHPGHAALRFRWTAPWAPGSGPFRAQVGDDWYAATQFEPVDARRAFPSFDEPRFKTPFEVTLAVPEKLVVISNAPEASAGAAAGGLRRVRFAATRPLPTYLVFWAVGPYEVVETTAAPNAVRAAPLPVRYVVPRGRTRDAAFAREAGAGVLAELERWFGTPYPYEKLDHVVVPGFSLAMENAGAISYAEDSLLFDPATQPDDTRTLIAVVMAHEIAHHWFGNWVTPPWWTEIWLNESFAEWMGIRAAARFRPELGLDAELRANAEAALEADALPSARAIRQPLERLEEVESQFDVMSYQKGGALLAMFERFAGEEPFRDGVRRYLAGHAHGTGSTEHLLAELSHAAGTDLAGPFGTFLDRPGAPLVTAVVSCEGATGRVGLRQSRAAANDAVSAAGGPWSVPVCLRYATAGGRVHERCTMLVAPAQSLELPEGCPEWLLPDAGGTGYYRWALAPADLVRLRERALPTLELAERISFAQSLRAAQRAGLLPYADAASALPALAADAAPEVAAEGMRAIEAARQWLVAPGPRAALEAVARRLYRPSFDRLGWEPREGEPVNIRHHRAALLAFLVEVANDADVRGEAARRGAAVVGANGAPPQPDAVAADLVEVAVGAMIAAGGLDAAGAVRARMARMRDTTARLQLAGALARAGDDAFAVATALLRDGAADLADRAQLLRRISTRPDAAARILAELERDLPTIAAPLPPFISDRLPDVVSSLCEPDSAARVTAAFAPHLDRFPAMAPGLQRAVERIRRCAADRAAHGPAATAWFEDAAGANGERR